MVKWEASGSGLEEAGYRRQTPALFLNPVAFSAMGDAGGCGLIAPSNRLMIVEC